MKIKHSPGVWKMYLSKEQDKKEGSWLITDGSHAAMKNIATVHCGSDMTKEETFANAKLITEANTLLVELQDAVHWMCALEGMDCSKDIARKQALINSITL